MHAAAENVLFQNNFNINANVLVVWYSIMPEPESRSSLAQRWIYGLELYTYNTFQAGKLIEKSTEREWNHEQKPVIYIFIQVEFLDLSSDCIHTL